jgi:hypothetical protein
MPGFHCPGGLAWLGIGTVEGTRTANEENNVSIVEKTVAAATGIAQQRREDNMSNWRDRLPDGVEYQDKTPDGFTLTVSMPTGDDGLLPLVCPVEPDHQFKVRVIQSSGGSPSDCHCPYCGHTAPTWDFMPAQMARVQEAAAGFGEQYLQQIFSDMLGDVARRNSGLSYRPGTLPPTRSLPAYEIEPTRRSMTCLQCGETFAVYGLAIYCPECGQLAPQQQFAELVRVQRDRLAALERLDDDIRRELEEAGVFTINYEGTFKDGFTALETYLKNRFDREATNVTKQPSSTTFQRLDDTNALYVAYVSGWSIRDLDRVDDGRRVRADRAGAAAVTGQRGAARQ